MVCGTTTIHLFYSSSRPYLARFTQLGFFCNAGPGYSIYIGVIAGLRFGIRDTFHWMPAKASICHHPISFPSGPSAQYKFRHFEDLLLDTFTIVDKLTFGPHTGCAGFEVCRAHCWRYRLSLEYSIFNTCANGCHSNLFK